MCKRAGMSRRTFYELFEDREDCFLASLEVVVQRIARDVVDVYEREGRWRERIRAALIVLLERLGTEPGVARVCLVETLKAGPRVLEYRRQVLDRLSVAVDEGRDEAKSGAGPAELTAESIVGGVLSVLHARVLAWVSATTEGSRMAGDPQPLIELLNPLMSMIVHPYLGSAAARRELDAATPKCNRKLPERTVNGSGSDPFRDLPMRFTYRTARVLATIASYPGANNREVGDAAGVHDQGQISKLLQRLQRNGLIVNEGEQRSKGEPNAWTLTQRGHTIHTTIDAHTPTA